MNQIGQTNLRQQPITNTVPQRPTGPKPQPRPEPMEVDQSFRSRAINYMNRPASGDKFGKRPSDTPSQNRKMQRNFHINAEEESEYQEVIEQADEDHEQSLEEHTENISDLDDNTDQVDISEIHFLD